MQIFETDSNAYDEVIHLVLQSACMSEYVLSKLIKEYGTIMHTLKASLCH